ncbi:AT-rich interactive domain-containing protein 3A-like [Heptranchias perlo]|uniref:AT-rich interactive domain-containing protein 3A-like n=1 Tax=Heptranchias perlo TaxID=212740 RepID=UPI00355A0A0C
MKLEAVMEHLQRQQQARLEMEGRERKDQEIRDAHIFYAQQLAAQQAALAAASSRSSPGSLVTALARPLAAGPTIPRVSDKSSMDSEPEDDAFEGEEPASDLEDEEMARGDLDDDDDDDGEEDEEEDVEYLRKQAAAALPTQRPPPAHHPSISGQSQQQGSSQPISPNQAHSKSPPSHHDWGYEEQFKQNPVPSSRLSNQNQYSLAHFKVYVNESKLVPKQFHSKLFIKLEEAVHFKTAEFQPKENYLRPVSGAKVTDVHIWLEIAVHPGLNARQAEITEAGNGSSEVVKIELGVISKHMEPAPMSVDDVAKG